MSLKSSDPMADAVEQAMESGAEITVDYTTGSFTTLEVAAPSNHLAMVEILLRDLWAYAYP